jgi:hypothetical protein
VLGRAACHPWRSCATAAAPDAESVQTASRATPSVQTVGDNLGWSVVAVGTTVLVGDPRDHAGIAAAGAAYLFDEILSTWCGMTFAS